MKLQVLRINELMQKATRMLTKQWFVKKKKRLGNYKKRPEIPDRLGNSKNTKKHHK